MGMDFQADDDLPVAGLAFEQFRGLCARAHRTIG
jgi:hypothetical protein